MNRFDLAGLMKEVETELTRPGGNFDTLYGHDPKLIEQARLITAIALTAADAYYSRLTLNEFRLREADEKGAK